MSCSQTHIAFLDILLTFGLTGNLNSDLYCKPTAGNTILRFNSSHPAPLLHSIPYCQYLRLRRKCSTDASFKEQADQLRTRLLQQEYTRTTLKKAFNRAKNQSRSQLLHLNKPKEDSQSMVHFITQYSRQHDSVRQSLHQFWPLLTSDPLMAQFVTAHSQITFRCSCLYVTC